MVRNGHGWSWTVIDGKVTVGDDKGFDGHGMRDSMVTVKGR